MTKKDAAEILAALKKLDIEMDSRLTKLEKEFLKQLVDEKKRYQIVLRSDHS